jgi:hypothetical protein
VRAIHERLQKHGWFADQWCKLQIVFCSAGVFDDKTQAIAAGLETIFGLDDGDVIFDFAGGRFCFRDITADT